MMQDGLHIGLAAWINQQRTASSFPVYPASPIAQALVELESIQNVQQSAQAAEFARLVNFIPRQGQVAEPFSDASILWRTHRDILTRMDHATEPWTQRDRAAFQAARNVLYTADASGRLMPSAKRLQYDEYKRAYEDLQRSCQDLQTSGGASAEELRARGEDVNRALADWLVAGFKSEVEDAYQVISTLGARSSLTASQNEALLLSEDPPGPGLRFHGDVAFAATYFAPVSAIARETWMEAKVSFVDLDLAVGNSPPNPRWKAFLANRIGEVTFNYMVISCIRPWYSPGLYQADDWRLRPPGQVVSQGNGTDGPLPAYVEAVYLAAVKDVTNRAPAPEPTGPVIPPGPRIPPGPIGRPPRGPILDRFDDPEVVRGKPGVLRKSLDATDINTGVVRKEMNTAMPVAAIRAGPILSADVQARPRGDIGESVFVERGDFVATRAGLTRKVTKVDVDQRRLVLQAVLAGQKWQPQTPPEAAPPQIYVVGFGCQKVPFAPNPNANYRWD